MQTITALFDDHDDASDAVGELESMGIPASDISVVANNSEGWHEGSASPAAEDAAGGAGIGAVVGGAGGLMAGLGALSIPGIGPVVAAGWLAATVAGAVTGAVVGGAAGGIIGGLTDAGVPENDAHVYAEGIRRGGTLVTARVSDDLAPQAREILQNPNSVDVSERRGAYEAEGWSAFDPAAGDYAEGITRDTVRRSDL
ncbi:hypothetical protein FJ930_28440 [Mesorhizobium sp. B2-4-15]|uniref:hypothetical protein n=1 Tax=unclassified Mesorhizobium TaxID=325217 RepID=UPI00112708CE|nr:MULTISPECIES: hypothetical protein [unclassified Mesorhizobium]TPK60669.1 hypothetical protein FJ930_28440 [Mesorhizobium sp. B2-4-15]TPM25328.1 hypothetical protein FJ958_21765 [Mesorhizobium sp. B2-3-5]